MGHALYALLGMRAAGARNLPVVALLRRYVPAVLADMELYETPNGPDCNKSLRQAAGLSFAEMVELARKANFRHTLSQIGEAVADTFNSVA